MRSMTGWWQALYGQFLIPGAVVFGQLQPPTLSESELTRLPQAVQSERGRAIAPGARWDWCRIPLMFDSDGSVRGGDSVVDMALARNTQECTARASAARTGTRENISPGQVHVRVEAVRVYADSVVVETHVRRAGGTQLEDYVLNRRFGPGRVLSVAMIRLRGGVVND
jgi:hypothetical protein